MVVVREQKGDRVLQTAEELHKKMVTSSIFFVKVLTATSYEKKYCNLWNLLLFISNKVHLRLVLCYFSIYYYLSEQRWDISRAAPVPRHSCGTRPRGIGNVGAESKSNFWLDCRRAHLHATAEEKIAGSAQWRVGRTQIILTQCMHGPLAHACQEQASRESETRPGFIYRTGQTVGIRYRYTVPIWPETDRYWSNLNFNSKNSVQSVRTGIPTD